MQASVNRWRMVAALIALTSACDGESTPPDDAAVGRDSESSPDTAVPPDSAITDAAGDAPTGTTEIRCYDFDGPSIVVTRMPDGSAETLLRVELGFRGGATGIVVDEVVQRDPLDQVVRRWTAPNAVPGFDGTLAARPGFPEPRAVWTATAPSDASELAVCDQPWYQRAGGHLEVSGATAQTGPFSVRCELNWHPAALDESLRFACARGIPGWLPDTFDALTDVSTPIDVVLLGTAAAAYGNSPADVTGLVATEVTVRSHLDTVFNPSCLEPVETWDPTGGAHTIWNGTSSTQIWSGPIPPGEIADFHWSFQVDGDAPSGYCVAPDDGTLPPGEACPAPSLQVVLRGTSSAGDWEWESDAFGCYDLDP